MYIFLLISIKFICIYDTDNYKEKNVLSLSHIKILYQKIVLHSVSNTANDKEDYVSFCTFVP